MPQIQTPLVQVLNQGAGQSDPGIFGRNFERSAKLGEFQQTAQQNREIQQRQQSQAELIQKATNIKGTADAVNKIVQDGGDVEGNVRSFLESKIRSLPDLGFDTKDSQLALDTLNNEGLDAVLKLANETSLAVQPFLANKKSTPNDFAKGQSFRVRDKDGKESIKTVRLDKDSGTIDLASTPLEGEFLSTLGETGGEQTKRLIGETRGKKSAQEKVAANRTFISDGLAAVDILPIQKRSLELLKTIKTGGIDKAAFQIKQFFGVEGADEAELSTNLARSVLSQLRATFGAQFTEREGDRLDRIENNIGKSSAGNKRLLEQLLKISEREAKRGLRSAKEEGDQVAFDAITEGMDFTFTPEEEKKPLLSLESSLDDLNKLSLEELKALRAKQGGQ